MANRELQYDELALDDPSVFAFEIDFRAFEGSPSRVFRAAAQLTEAFASLDAAFASAIDRRIETDLVILRIENGSLKSWIASILRSIDDEALKDLDLKKLIGAYLVRAKYLALEWLESDDGPHSLRLLEDAILDEARLSDVRLIPAYERPSRPLLIEGLRKIQIAKDTLSEGDAIRFESASGAVEISPERTLDFDKVSDVDVSSKQSFELHHAHLVVKKPDYLGHSQWQLKFKERTVRAAIRDTIWLTRFHARDIPLKPGDAIVCDADFTIYFDQTGTPISETVVVTKVYGIEFQSPPQDGFL